MDNSSLDNVSDRDHQCQLAHSIVDQPLYRGIVAGECIAAALACVPNFLVLSVIWKVTVFPPNLRLLLGHFSVIFLWYSIGSLIKCIYLLTANPCGFAFSALECKIFDLASIVVVLPILFYNMLLLCMERLYATIRYKKYDKTAAKKPWLALLLIGASWGCAFYIHASPAFSMTFNESVPMCESSFMPVKSVTVYVVYLVLEIIGCIVTVFTFLYNYFVSRNMAINRARYDLSSRFQVDQNVHVNTILVPSMVIEVICHIPIFIAMIGIRGRPDINIDTKAWLQQVTYLWRLFYALCHPLLALRPGSHCHQRLRTGPFGRFFGAKVANSSSMASVHIIAGQTPATHREAYFLQLNRQWAKNPNKVTPKQPPLTGR